jgi:hypothetical protein
MPTLPADEPPPRRHLRAVPGPEPTADEDSRGTARPRSDDGVTVITPAGLPVLNSGAARVLLSLLCIAGPATADDQSAAA